MVRSLGFLTTTILTLPTVSAFAPSWSMRPGHCRQPLHQSKLSEMEEICIENVAEFCLNASNKIDQGCDLEEYTALVNQLMDQREQLSKHVDYIDGLLAKLQGSAPEGVVKEDNAYIAG